jgi:choline dehydrogenase
MAQNTIYRGLRHSTATQYLRPARKRENLFILQGAEVTSLILEGKRCVGVRYRRGGAIHEMRARREVILSAGTLASPKLLELSGIGNPDILARHGMTVSHGLKGIGENLRDHYGSTLEWKFNRSGISWAEKGRGWRLAAEATRYVLRRNGFISQGWATLRVFGRSHDGVEDADLALMANHFLLQVKGTKRSMSPVNGFFIYAQVQRPESAGSVHLKSADPTSDPAIVYNFLTKERDCYTAVMAVRRAREIAAAKRTWATREEARRDLFGYIEGYYNRQRIPSALGYLTPEQAERTAS